MPDRVDFHSAAEHVADTVARLVPDYRDRNEILAVVESLVNHPDSGLNRVAWMEAPDDLAMLDLGE